MTNDIELTRRKALAALGSIGAASAGAGLGTSAYFSDSEQFMGNTLTAGALDLKVDWEEHYSDWSDDESDGLENEVVMTNSDPAAVPDGYVGLPDPESPLIAVADGDLDRFMDNTAIEAYPDPDDDGIQDAFAANPGETTAKGVGYICADGADTPDGLDPVAGFRTENDDTLTEAGDVKPLVSIDDVKPGDFGELTLSYHICDNPAYVWFDGELLSNAENGLTEPEAKDPDENNVPGDPVTGFDGELLDAIKTRLWYDDGDNVVEVDGEDPDDRGYLTPELSLGELLLFLEGGDGIQLCPTDGAVVQPPVDAANCPPEKDVDSEHRTGEVVTIDTPLTDGATQFTIPQNPKCIDFGLLQGVKTDEAPEGVLPPNGTTVYSTTYGDFTVTTAMVKGSQTITDWSLDSPDGFCVAKVIVKGGQSGGTVYSYDNDNADADFTNDDDIGTRSDVDASLQTPTGQEISHVSFCLAIETDDRGEKPPEGDCCFEPSTDHFLGLAWWLPVDHANELQTDSVAFDLGFYTEQCRHNRGEGRSPA